ncbi:GntR family transcriptional regulator [Pseudomonas gingeri NCPPB 3146 = LMG 5327]|uniref:GntR family transcriptional regulator n=2 Tax=Pseudomonas gingeri TaxID=117681 RepID=A0A7Y7Y5Z5_9PSED|nr:MULTISPECIES: GntR family transcriptional regulator [Pseudomonas]NWC17783.1 GntR family transcriptional regulator [Pseudomonas gingeri]NWE69117.1 GntR family transcriptional regulator [Pseudomonas gingeri]PNQ88669.1 GntR family transcriptional regulator [Pseudomonas gingeri NCPPB 3146 = LMG 5327]BBP76246.1 HTH-type transcriptional repressor YvoA [Pseudomonas sp. Ost2]
MPLTDPIPSNEVAVPLYKQLAETLRQQIESGELNDQEPLAPERELALHYKVSRDTVRKAIRLLDEEGMIYSDHGRGTFITSAPLRNMAKAIGSFTLDTLKRGGVPGQKVLVFEKVTAGMAIGSVLNIKPDTVLHHVKRVRLIDGEPIGIQDSWLCLPKGLGFTREQLERKGSLYRLLVEELQIQPSLALESIGSILASEQDVELLNLDKGAPLLLCERVTMSERRVPIEYCEMRYGPSYRYKNKVTQWGGN